MGGRVAGTVTFADGGSWDTSRRTHILGILNVTPDSFSDGGRFFDEGRAAAYAARLAEEGADAVDIGGESSRPGADPVTPQEERRRVLPVLKRVRRELPAMRLSVDTTRAALAREALGEGADLVNDVSALSEDPAMAPAVAATRAACILMHRRGTSRTMQDDPRYDDVMGEICAELGQAMRRAREAGVREDGIVLDPGIGFGKTLPQNIEIFRRLGELVGLGAPVLVGASRKSFIATLSRVPPERMEERFEGSLGAAAAAILAGATLLRVHDVAGTVRMARVVDAISRGGPACS
jgi:dihydropteroate synthase